jgi:hypothetical protein
VSSATDLTWLTCTPNDRCTPLHVRHTNTPKLTLAQVGLRAPQSAQARLPSKRARAATARLKRSASAAVTLAFALLKQLIVCAFV